MTWGGQYGETVTQFLERKRNELAERLSARHEMLTNRSVPYTPPRWINQPAGMPASGGLKRMRQLFDIGDFRAHGELR